MIRRALTALFLVVAAGSAQAAPPVIICPPAQSTYETHQVEFTVTASDPDGDPVTLTLVNKPVRAAFDPSEGYFYWVTNYVEAGFYNLEFRATAGGQTVNCFVPVTIENFDRVPVFNCPAPVTAAVGDTVKVQLTATDADKNDVLTYTSPNLPAGATLTPQGKFTWPTAGANVGTRTVSFTVDDGTVTQSCSLTITLNPPPVQLQIFCPPSIQVQETTIIDFSVAAEGPSNHPPVVTCLNPPAGAIVTGAHFHWTPDFSQQGVYDVVFRAVNNFDLPAQCTVRITVLDLDPSQPLFDTCPGPTISSPENVFIGFAVNATDPLGSPLTYTAQNLPAGATFNTNTHQFTWTPTFTQAGNYDVTFKADNGAKFALCAVHFQITDRVPGAPTLTCPGPRQVAERTDLAFNVTATDPNGLPVTFSLVGPPAGATVTPTGAFHWRPTSTQAGSYTLRFQAANPQTASTCDVPVTVTDRPFTPPVVACPGDQITYELHATNLFVTSTDVDGDAPTYLSRNLPAGAQFSAAGLFTWTPTASQSGTYFPQFIVTDGDLRDSCTVRVEVLNQDTALGANEAKIVRIDDIRPDQGGWVRVLFVSATNDRVSGNVSGYDVWRRIAGPVISAAANVDDAPPRTLAEAGGEIDARTAQVLGFPDGAWEAVAHVPALQSLDLLVAAPTRRDSTAGGRPYETYVVTTQTTSTGTWAVSASANGYSVDDLAPAAPSTPNLARAGDAVTLTWAAVPDLDLESYVIERGASEAFAPGEVLGTTGGLAFTDPAAPEGAWYRVLARDVHGNVSASPAISGGGGPAVLALTAPRPNPSVAGIAFEALLPRGGTVSLAIYDARGRIVRVLERGTVAAGRHPYAWDRADAAGRTMPAGVYVVRLETPDGVRTRKVTLTR